jgi:hypothetical protein
VKAIKNEGYQDWGTPRWFMRQLADLGMVYDLDVCATEETAVCSRYLSYPDGLSAPWKADKFWCNPPWNDIGKWASFGIACIRDGYSRSGDYLVPARTETRWFRQLYRAAEAMYLVYPRLNYYDTRKGRIVNGIAVGSAIFHLTRYSVVDPDITFPVLGYMHAVRPKGAER